MSFHHPDQKLCTNTCLIDNSCSSQNKHQKQVLTCVTFFKVDIRILGTDMVIVGKYF